MVISHKCHYCNKTFSRKFNLEVHMRTHLDVRKHVCPICGQNFTQKSNLKRHVKRKVRFWCCFSSFLDVIHWWEVRGTKLERCFIPGFLWVKIAKHTDYMLHLGISCCENASFVIIYRRCPHIFVWQCVTSFFNLERCAKAPRWSSFVSCIRF